jgi:hypothetical protein
MISTPYWLKKRIQRDSEKPLSAKERLGLALGILYLLFVSLLAARYLETWLTPAPQEKALHRRCVLIATEMAKGSDSSYRANYDLCMQGEFK